MHPGFIVIPQNGAELLSDDGRGPHEAYLAAIDGQGQEDLFYGYARDDRPTRKADTDYLTPLLDIALAAGKGVFVTDYCRTPSKVDDSYARNAARGYVSFAAHRRGLDAVPLYPLPFPGVNRDDAVALCRVRNFLYLIDPARFASKDDFISAVSATDYDMLIIDLFFNDGQPLSSADLERLQRKACGSRRLVLAYMSIGEAESYRYYWRPDWRPGSPEWMCAENPDWKGNFKVRYWDRRWQDIICLGDDSYLGRILAAGFDGVYLDIIDAFEYFEQDS